MTTKNYDQRLPGKVLSEKLLEDNKEDKVLQLVEFVSDVLEPGTRYRLMRLFEGNLMSQYPAGTNSFEKQKDLEGVAKMYEAVSSIRDFRRLQNPDYDKQEALRGLVSLFSFGGGR
ncbi:MAG: hypothetical protein ABIB79_01720 [archaeon]